MKTLTFNFRLLHEAISISISRHKATAQKVNERAQKRTTAEAAHWPEFIGIR